MSATSPSGAFERSLKIGHLTVLIFFMIALVTAGAATAGDKEKAKKPKDLPERWRVWLEEEVYPLIDSDQSKAFLELETDAQREAYAQRLWALWGRRTGYGSAFRHMYEERLNFCRSEFNNTHEDRARVMLIHGYPDFRRKYRCSDLLNPLEIWVYGYIEGLGESIVLLFYQPFGMGLYRLWNPIFGWSSLYTSMGWSQANRPYRNMFDRPEMRCPNGDEMFRLMNAAAVVMKDIKVVSWMHHMPRAEDHGPESTSTRFMEFSALLPNKHVPLDFEISSAPRAKRGGTVRMGFNVKVPTEGLGTAEVGDVDVVQLDVVGEISRAEEMVDRFRYLFSVPAASNEVALLLERSIRPGDYTIRLKVEDVHSRMAGVTENEFVARPPTADELAVLGAAMEAARDEEDDEELIESPEEQTLILLGPEGEAVSGLHRFEAVTTPEVARVSFYVDGREVLTKNRPPFDVDLDLGDLPKLTTVSAIAYDKHGMEVDRKQLSLNVGRERFYLRLQPFGPGDRQGDKVFVNVLVNTPSDLDLEKLELYWNEAQLATLFEEPYEAWVDIGSRSNQFGYLRAVATLTDGSQAEDIQFVNAPIFGDEIDVTAVELPVTVLDRGSHPIVDLTAEDFTVLEDGVEQTITHCSLREDLPIRVGIVVDTSGSMERTLPEVQRVVMVFLRDLLGPRDRAFIETFSDQPDLIANFTADFDTLENAMLALYPDRATAFYDAVITALFQFSGIRGRRAMIVLTDGADTASKHTYDETVAYSQRTGTTIYTIGINIPSSQVIVRWQLSNLSKVTGGKAFFLGLGANLERVYGEIDRELRTQYVLAFTSSSERPPDELRKIKVKVKRRGATVRTISGYYPGSF